MHVEFRYSNKTHGMGNKITHINLEEESSLDRARTILGFDGIDLYQKLLSKKDVVKVELAGVLVKYNSFSCKGLASAYRITYADGRTKIYKDKGNFQESWHRHNSSERLMLKDGEFICGLYLNQGEIIDGITFVTNRRQVHIGSGKSNFIDMTCPIKKRQRIIAFAGQFRRIDGVLSRIGYYSVKTGGWETVREYIMLRWLLENNRAEEYTSFDSRVLLKAHKDQVCIRWVVNPDTPKDIVRQVLRYLFYTMPSFE